MNFKSNEVPQEKVRANKILGVGFNLVKIVDYKLKTAQSGLQQLTLLVEGKPDNSISEPFSHKDGILFGESPSNGAIASVDISIYKDYQNPTVQSAIATNMRIIAKALDTEKELDAIEASEVSSVEEYFSKVINSFVGKGFLYMAFKGEERINKSDKVFVNLSASEFPIKQLDGSNVYYLRAIPEKDVVKIEDDGTVQSVTVKGATGVRKVTFDRSSTYNLKKAVKPDADLLPPMPLMPDVDSDELPY